MTKTQKKPDFLHKEFEIDGKKYIYDFNLLEGTAIRVAIRNYQLAHKMIEILPTNAKEMQLITQSQVEKAFYAAIFIAVDENGKFIPYEEHSPATYPVLTARGKQMEELREVCKADFLFHSNLSNIELLKKSKDLIEMLQSMDTETGKKVIERILNPSDLSNKAISEKTSTQEVGN
jgi:hypothetical protein